MTLDFYKHKFYAYSVLGNKLEELNIKEHKSWKLC